MNLITYVADFKFAKNSKQILRHGKAISIYDFFRLDNISFHQNLFFLSVVYEFFSIIINILLLASVEGLINRYSVSLAQYTFHCSQNATTIRILRFLCILMRPSFLLYDFISRQRLHKILSPEIKFNFYQNDSNETKPAMSFISRHSM